ncbi:unnamed protein product [Arctogadus glacialis]
MALMALIIAIIHRKNKKAAELLHPSAFSPDSEEVMEEDGGVESEGHEGYSKGEEREEERTGGEGGRGRALQNSFTREAYWSSERHNCLQKKRHH